MAVDLEIVSPERLLLSRPVELVVIPASEGDIGVLPQHSPMIVLLRGGTIRIYEGNQVQEQFYVAGGFAEITAERCTVLANEAIPLAEVSRTEADRRLEAAEKLYAETDRADFRALDAAMDQMQSARAMQDAAQAG